jgi:hypothetical protein
MAYSIDTIVESRNKQRSRVGGMYLIRTRARLSSKYGTTPLLARKLPQRFADLFA